MTCEVCNTNYATNHIIKLYTRSSYNEPPKYMYFQACFYMPLHIKVDCVCLRVRVPVVSMKSSGSYFLCTYYYCYLFYLSISYVVISLRIFIFRE